VLMFDLLTFSFCFPVVATALMPFKSRARRSMRRRRSRPSRRRRGSSTRSIALRALKATDQERKLVDTLFVNIPINDTVTMSTIVPVNLTAEGTDFTDRIGRKILMKSVYLQLNFARPFGVATPQTNFVRMMVILDRQVNGALPTMSQILDLPGSGDPSVEMMSPNNINNSKRFVTLWDHRFSLYNGFIEGRMLKKFIRLDQTVQYSGTTATIGACRTNALYAVFIGNSATGSADNVEIDGLIRFRFVG